MQNSAFKEGMNAKIISEERLMSNMFSENKD
jgi:hypothetical protein